MYKYDSNEEIYFSWYLKELADKGIIINWEYHPKTFILSEKVTHVFHKQLKTKDVVKNSVILNDHRYQADFLIHWNAGWEGRIFMCLDGLLSTRYAFIANINKEGVPFSVIDIKGSFARPHNNSAITFPLNQKWVYQKYNIYVQKIIPQHLFKETFVPVRFLLTDKSGRARRIDYKPISISQYIESIKE